MSDERPERNMMIERFKLHGWPCVCTQRDRQGRLTHIKVNEPWVERCQVCGTWRAEVEAAARRKGNGLTS